jgi:hypothetical protein
MGTQRSGQNTKKAAGTWQLFLIFGDASWQITAGKLPSEPKWQ